jgi:hypothetical protein
MSNSNKKDYSNKSEHNNTKDKLKYKINNNKNTQENTDKFKINQQKESLCDEKSFVGGIIKKIKEGISNDSIKNELITPIYDEIILHIYPHYLIFFTLMVVILFLEILIFFAIFATIKLR